MVVILVRRAKNDDIESIVKLWKEMMSFHIELDPVYDMKPNAPELFRSYALDCIGDMEKRVFVCCSNDQIVGVVFACISEHPPVYLDSRIGEVSSLCVTKEYRRKGAGKMLAAECEKWFRENGIGRAECMVSSTNPLSQAFWKACGYTEYNKQCCKRLYGVPNKT